MSKCQTKSLFGDDDLSVSDGSGDDGYVVRVAFENGADSVFDYKVPDKLWPVGVGQRVQVPFGRSNKALEAFVVSIVTEEEKAEDKKKFRLKSVKSIVDDKPLVNTELMDLAKWICHYYVCPLGQVLAAMVPAAVKKGIGVKQQSYLYLAENYEDAKVKGKKQKRILEVLADEGAVCDKTGIEKPILLELAECTAAPLKSLLINGIIKQVRRSVMRSLPQVPEGLRGTEREVVPIRFASS